MICDVMNLCDICEIAMRVCCGTVVCMFVHVLPVVFLPLPSCSSIFARSGITLSYLTATMVGLIIFTIVFELSLHHLEHWLERHHRTYLEMLRKIYKVQRSNNIQHNTHTTATTDMVGDMATGTGMETGTGMGMGTGMGDVECDVGMYMWRCDFLMCCCSIYICLVCRS